MDAKNTDERVILQLSRDEALILFDWLVRFNEVERHSMIEDQSEQRILFDLESVLERNLDEILKADYKDTLNISRKNIRDKP